MSQKKGSKRTNLNFRQTQKSRSADKSNVNFGFIQRMEPYRKKGV